MIGFGTTSRLSGRRALPDSVVRRNWAPSALLVVATLAVCIFSYSLSMKVATERREVESLARQNHTLSAQLKSLDAELRVRMRLPQLQRWNDQVLGMVPISASQFLPDPLQLASYAAPPAEPQPQVQFAVRDLAPVAEPPAAAPQLLRASTPPVVRSPDAVAKQAEQRPAERAESRVNHHAPQAIQRPAVASVAPVAMGRTVSWADGSSAPMARPAPRTQEAPADLLAQIELTFAGPPGQPTEP